jgi:hypothetical protein
VAAVLALCLAVVAGCGSSASTSHAEAVAVAKAEREFLAAFRRANGQAKARCEARTTSDADFTHCIAAVAGPRTGAAEVRYQRAMEEVLAGGVGRDCAKEIESALGDVPEVPFYPGEVMAACRGDDASPPVAGQ